VKEQMSEVSGIDGDLVWCGAGDCRTNCPIVVDVNGAASDKKLGVVSID